jgi:hypothetical protein
MVKTDFTYTDEFGEESRLTKLFTNSIFIEQTPFEFLVNEFKLFLLGAGFGQENVDRIQIVED